MSYVKIYVHAVWGTKNRSPFLTSENKIIIVQHIRENAITKGIHISSINGHLDHIHCLIALNPNNVLLMLYN